MGDFDVAILGAGPGGCTLAALLAQRGMRVLVFDDEKRPELLVGESLLPPVVDLLRRFGLEERTKAFSTFKPGVAFMHRGGLRLDFFFPERALGDTPSYAYNVPRREFDAMLRERAEELGATFVKCRAEVEVGDEDAEVRLTRRCLDATPELGGRHPKLLVDATGRRRLFARTLEIPARRGERNDVAYFAHFEDFDAEESKPGQVVLSILEHGWSWRIPLPGRLSVGVVVDGEVAKGHGRTPEERLESLIDAEPILASAGKGRRRITEVMAYSNYQLISDRGHGPGWLSMGDAFGFVDPMLSPGLFMAMHMADLLDREVFAKGAIEDPERFDRAATRVEEEVREWHAAWGDIIEFFYDGRMYSLYEGGVKLRESAPKWAPAAMMERYLSRWITRIVSGVDTRSRYGRGLVRFTANHLMHDVEPPEFYAVRGASDDAA